MSKESKTADEAEGSLHMTICLRSSFLEVMGNHMPVHSQTFLFTDYRPSSGIDTGNAEMKEVPEFGAQSL